MDVQVGIETQGPPTAERLEILRRAAAWFAENKANISVTHTVMPDGHCLVVQFTMRTVAQYKVIDEIAKGFKMDIWDFAITWICGLRFPKVSRRAAGKAVSLAYLRLSIVEPPLTDASDSILQASTSNSF